MRGTLRPATCQKCGVSCLGTVEKSVLVLRVAMHAYLLGADRAGP